MRRNTFQREERADEEEAVPARVATGEARDRPIDARRRRHAVDAKAPSTTPRRYGGVNIFHLLLSLPLRTSANAPKRDVPPSVVAIASRNSFAN